METVKIICRETMETVRNEKLFTFRCEACRKSFETEYGKILHKCPDCGGKLLFDSEHSAPMKVDAVVPFAIKEADLPKLVRRYAGEIFARPMLVRPLMTVKKRFVPFYMFYSRVDGTVMLRGNQYHWDATTNFRHDISAYCAGETDLNAICVDASDAMPDELMDELEPFDLTTALTDIPEKDGDAEVKEVTTSLEECIRRADALSVKAIARETGRHLALQDIEVLEGESELMTTDMRVYLTLLPVYLVSFRPGKETRTYAVNGQTGEVTGEKTNSVWKKSAFFACLAAVPVLFFLLLQLMTHGTVKLSGHVGLFIFLECVAFAYGFIMLGAAKARLNAPGKYAHHIPEGGFGRLHTSSHLNAVESASIFKEKHYWRAIGQIILRVTLMILRVLVKTAVMSALSGSGHASHSGGGYSHGSSGHSFGGGHSRGGGAGRGR